jgi:putative oxidoreductase
MSSIGTFITELHTWEWLAILVARLTVGLLFFLSGRGKLFVRERREQMRQTLLEAHIPFPQFNALFVSTVDLSSVCCSSTTAVRKIKASSPLGWLSEFLYLPEVLYLVILVWVFLSGLGWFSIDHLNCRRLDSSNAVGEFLSTGLVGLPMAGLEPAITCGIAIQHAAYERHTPLRLSCRLFLYQRVSQDLSCT